MPVVVRPMRPATSTDMFDPFVESDRARFAAQARAEKVAKVIAELDRCAFIVGVPRLAGKSGAQFFCSMTAAQVMALYKAAGVRPGSETTFNLIMRAIRERTA